MELASIEQINRHLEIENKIMRKALEEILTFTDRNLVIKASLPTINITAKMALDDLRKLAEVGITQNTQNRAHSASKDLAHEKTLHENGNLGGKTE